MKSRILFSSVLWLAAQNLTLATEAPAPTIELKGIIASSDPKVLIEVRTSRAPGPVATAPRPDEKRSLILAKGQKDGEFEVVDIDEIHGKVTLLNKGQILQLTLDATPSPATPSSSAPAISEKTEAVSLVGLHRVDLNQALQLYQLVAHRSVIRPASLPGSLGLELAAKQAAGTGAEKAIEQALTEKGINIQLDGDKFAIVSGDGADREKITRDLGKTHALAVTIENTRKASTKAHAGGPSSATSPEPAGVEEILPAGVINFPATDLNQVLEIYGELTDRTLIRTFPLPAMVISFQNCTPLTREDTIYALTAVLAINGVSITTAGDKFLLVVPTFQEEQIARLRSKKGPLDYSTLTNTVSTGSLNLRSGGLEIFAQVCGQLAGRKLEVSPGVPHISLGLRSQTELTAGEALHALDLLFGLHGLKVTSREESATLTIVAESQRPK